MGNTIHCKECGGATAYIEGCLVHADTESVQCVSAEHCTACGHIVDYNTAKKAWIHDELCIRPGVVEPGANIPPHDPVPEFGTLLNY